MKRTAQLIELAEIRVLNRRIDPSMKNLSSVSTVTEPGKIEPGKIIRMQDIPPPTELRNPAEIAREAFRMLATRRIAPTPEAYRTAYIEISGKKETESAETVLMQFANLLGRSNGESADFGLRLKRTVQSGDWHECGRTLGLLLDKRLERKAPTVGMTSIHIANDAEEANVLRGLLSRTLTIAVAALVQGAPELLNEAENLGLAVKDSVSEEDLILIAGRLKQFCYRIETRSGELSEQQEMMRRLLSLLLENISELIEDDSWLSGQIDVVRNIISGHIDIAMLENATQSLKEVIYKQSAVKHSLNEAKVTLKNMMMTFVDRLGSVAAKTGSYNEKIAVYAQKIGKATDITTLNIILDEVMRETQMVQAETLLAREAMIAAQMEVEHAETRIRKLESELDFVSEKLREDQLTGSLNRRGLKEAFEREAARADRNGLPLCVGILDIDNFKKLNDTYGHSAGDQALIHLTEIIRQTLRPTDDVARYGGEEFVILLPETGIDNGIEVLTRMQRQLTKHFFMHNHERLLITFSAGVALRLPKETQEAVIERADAALYSAKHNGKNRVVAAP